MTQNTQQDELWQPLPPGGLQAYAQRDAGRRRNRQITVASTCVGMLLLCVLGWWSLQRDSETEGLACHQVIPMLPAYAAGELDADQMEQIRAHLDYCVDCQQKLEEIQSAGVQVAAAEAAPTNVSS